MATNRFAYDTIYYWTGGAEKGEWRETLDCSDEILRDIHRGGRVAYKGRRSIGPPDTPPTIEEIAAVMSGRIR